MKHHAHNSPLASAQQGVVLLEALIAVLLFTFGILGLLGLQAAMVKNTTDAQYRAEATFRVQQKIGELWANPCNLKDYADENTDEAQKLVPELPNGRISVTLWGEEVQGGTCPGKQREQVQVELTWMLPGEGDSSLDRADSAWRRVVQNVSIGGG